MFPCKQVHVCVDSMCLLPVCAQGRTCVCVSMCVCVCCFREGACCSVLLYNAYCITTGSVWAAPAIWRDATPYCA